MAAYIKNPASRATRPARMANFVGLEGPGGDRFIIYIKQLANGHSRILLVAMQASIAFQRSDEEIKFISAPGGGYGLRNWRGVWTAEKPTARDRSEIGVNMLRVLAPAFAVPAQLNIRSGIGTWR